MKLEAILPHKRLARDSGKGVLSEHTCKGLFPFSTFLQHPALNPQQQQEKEWKQSHGQQNVSA